jgi:hypothetical protein
MTTFPEKWGFEKDLRKCIGRTIESADIVEMPYGCTWRSAWAVRFTDGSRAFFVGSTGSGIVNPLREAVEKCSIFTSKEVGEMAEADAAKRRRDKAEDRRRKEAQLESLRKELGQ